MRSSPISRRWSQATPCEEPSDSSRPHSRAARRSLSSDHPSAQVPASVFIAGGNSANSFTVTTSSSSSFGRPISATTGGEAKSVFLTIFENPNASASLSAVRRAQRVVSGGTSIPATVTLSGAAPSGGAIVTLSTSNTAAQVPARSPCRQVKPHAASRSRHRGDHKHAGDDHRDLWHDQIGDHHRAARLEHQQYGTLSRPPMPLIPGATATVSRPTLPALMETTRPALLTPTAAPPPAHRARARDAISIASLITNLVPSGQRFRHRGRLDARWTARRLTANVRAAFLERRRFVDAAKRPPTLSTTMTPGRWEGNDTWGRTWTPAELSNANFRVRVINAADSTSRDSRSTGSPCGDVLATRAG